MAREIKNILVHHLFENELKRCAFAYFSGRLIDIGCGDKPYEALLLKHVAEYKGLEHKDTPHDKSKVDIWGTAYHIPVPDASFDSAMCIAVLEHLEEPAAALAECYRVLKPGGLAFYSAPFIWHLHEAPRDFFRYSRYGLDYLFRKAGFEIVELRALSGFWATFGQLLVYNLYRLNRGPLRWLRIIDGIGLLLQLFFYVLNRIDKTEEWTWCYAVVARKNGAVRKPD